MGVKLASTFAAKDNTVTGFPSPCGVMGVKQAIDLAYAQLNEKGFRPLAG